MTEIEEATARFNKKQEKRRKSGYFDPIHVPSEKLVVTYEGREIWLMNKRLLDQQMCWENLEAIKEVHWLKMLFFHLIEDTKDPIELKELAKDLTECEFELQRLWKFPLDKKFHRFWDYHKCECPKMDNDDAWPTGYYVVAGNCPLHGE